MSREQLFAAFFFAVFLFLLYQFYLFLAVFFVPIVWAAILALTFYPLTAWLVRVFRGNRGLAAGVLVLAVTVGVLLPSFFLGSLLVREATGAYTRLQEMVRQGELTAYLAHLRTSRIGILWDRITSFFGEQTPIDPADILLRATNWLSNEIVGQATGLARNALVTVVDFVLMLVALFVFFRDGERMAGAVRDLLPMEREHKDAILERLSTTLTAVVQSMVLTAATQGLLAGLGYWLIADLGFSVFLGFVTGLASFLPLAGPAFVWGATATYLMLTGHFGRGVALAVWGTLVVSTADNFIKPLFIGERANLPAFLLLFSLLGGLAVYGFLGVFLGPVILATLIVFVQIFREEYNEPQVAIVPPHPPPLERRAGQP
jgi:predicted PurR-regulated permease PerM